MKILCTEFSAQGTVSTVTAGDDMLLRINQDFYVPEFAEYLSCVPQVVVKIDKLGKYISERFASRYYNQMAAGIIFHADALEEKMRIEELPIAPSFTFEGAGALGEMQPFKPNAELTFKINGQEIFTQNISELPITIDKGVSEASKYHLMKIGDLVYSGNNLRFPIKVGDKLELTLNGHPLFCEIK